MLSIVLIIITIITSGGALYYVSNVSTRVKSVSEDLEGVSDSLQSVSESILALSDTTVEIADKVGGARARFGCSGNRNPVHHPSNWKQVRYGDFVHDPHIHHSG